MTVRFFLTSSIPCIPWIWMNVFHLKKLSKKIAWQYQLIWIRWSELNRFFKRKEDSKLILNLLPFPKCSSFFVSKTSPFEWIYWCCLWQGAMGRDYPTFSSPASPDAEKSCTSESCPFHYNFLKYLWVISPSCLRQKPKFLEQVHWCSSYWDVV